MAENTITRCVACSVVSTNRIRFSGPQGRPQEHTTLARRPRVWKRQADLKSKSPNAIHWDTSPEQLAETIRELELKDTRTLLEGLCNSLATGKAGDETQLASSIPCQLPQTPRNDMQWLLSDGGKTVLQVAAEEGNIEVVRFLLRASPPYHQPDIDASLCFAAAAGHVEVVRHLVAAITNAQQVSESLDAFNNDSKRKTSLCPALLAAAKAGQLETVRLLAPLVNYQDVANATTEAIESDQVEVVKWLLSMRSAAGPAAGAALLHAASSGSVEVVRHLLAAGVDPDVFDPEDEERDTPLDLAVDSGHQGAPMVLRLLIEHGANPTGTEVETLQPPLFRAIMKAKMPESAALIAAAPGTDFRRCDNYGLQERRTYLHLAAAQGYVEVGRQLLDAGFSPNPSPRTPSLTSGDPTPLDEAIAGRHPDFIRLLHARGAHFDEAALLGGLTSPGLWDKTGTTATVAAILSCLQSHKLSDSPSDRDKATRYQALCHIVAAAARNCPTAEATHFTELLVQVGALDASVVSEGMVATVLNEVNEREDADEAVVLVDMLSRWMPTSLGESVLEKVKGMHTGWILGSSLTEPVVKCLGPSVDSVLLDAGVDDDVAI